MSHSACPCPQRIASLLVSWALIKLINQLRTPNWRLWMWIVTALSPILVLITPLVQTVPRPRQAVLDLPPLLCSRHQSDVLALPQQFSFGQPRDKRLIRLVFNCVNCGEAMGISSGSSLSFHCDPCIIRRCFPFLSSSYSPSV